MDYRTKMMHDWYMKEENKRKENRKNSEIHSLNNQLQNLLKPAYYKMKDSVERESFEKISAYCRRYLVQCSIFDLGYRNNFENLEVAILQYVILEKIYTFLGKDVSHLGRFKSMIGNIDYGSLQLIRQHEYKLKDIEFKSIETE